MPKINPDKIVIFGAGRIGRSFIGQLFSLGGFEVVFIDISPRIIGELNRRHHYHVIIKAENEEVINIKNVRGVLAADLAAAAREVATASIVAVSVGINGLGEIFPILASGLNERCLIDNQAPLDIIIAENMRNADVYFRDELTKRLPPGYPIDRLVGLIETSIGKMVPIMLNKDVEEDILQVFAEPYNTLILDQKAFKNPIPRVSGLAPKENMKAWVDRKLFIHNLGHAAAAYAGYLYNPEFVFMHEALAVDEIYLSTRNVMLQSAAILMKRYPLEFSESDLTSHIDDLLYRFQNKFLGDTIFRVGCDLFRKLGPEDRLSGAIRAALDLRLPYGRILKALVYGMHFRAKDERGDLYPQDKEFIKLYEKGCKQVLSVACGFDETENPGLFREAAAIDAHLKASGR